MDQPLVSVKMITYNHAAYIAQAIDGVLMQKTTFPFELVIGEDCSTDGTREIVFDYARRYPDIIRVITSENNVGVKKNGFRTSQACRGKYIAYCEGDDYWHREDKLQIQVDYLQSHPDCGLVCSDYDLVYVNKPLKICNYRKNSRKKIIASPKIRHILTGNAGILTCTVLARKNLVERLVQSDPHLYKSDRFKMGDTQLWAELSLVSNIHYMDQALATHLLLEESATQSKDIQKSLAFWVSNSEMCLYLCDKHNLPENIREVHIKNWRRASLQLAFFEKNIDRAEQVKQKYPALTLKDRIWYWGTQYPILRPLITFIRKAKGM